MEFCRSTALPHLEGRRSCQENTCYRPHSHDVLSIGVIDAGSSVLTTPASDPVNLETGNVIVIPANQVHACKGLLHGEVTSDLACPLGGLEGCAPCPLHIPESSAKTSFVWRAPARMASRSRRSLVTSAFTR
ncbi:AraC family ligand binding domain-containing protein [Kocuria carniphila]|uniref:AraC family ligand binding domain-containing protein n=1 Tax=Kocuria carniphila TaxID=262208 RepID=UPI001930F1F1|nr:AraC family ligand binding domain-containing protein [Kocuria carniphila]